MKLFTAITAYICLASVMLVARSVAASHPAGHVKDFRDQVTAIRDDFRETRLVEKLSVNTGIKFRLVSRNKCEKEGEFELHRLASRPGVEESYVLIPHLCLWIEVGYAEKRNRVRLDEKFIIRLMKQHNTLSFYHIHAGALPEFENYFPAYKDLITLALINSRFIWDSQANIKHLLITRYGKMEYGLTSKNKVRKFMDQYRRAGLKGFESQNLAYEYLRFKYRSEYYSKIEECKSKSGRIQDKIVSCSPITTEAFTLKFQPIRSAMN